MHPSYYKTRRFDRAIYRANPIKIEARQMTTLMFDSYARYRNNYRWNVPCSVEVKTVDALIAIVDPRSPKQPPCFSHLL